MFKLTTQRNLFFEVPVDAASAGAYIIQIKASTRYNKDIYLQVELTLIDPCASEEVIHLDGAILKKTFTILETYDASQLQFDLTRKLESNRKGKGCPQFTFHLASDENGGALSDIQEFIFTL